MPDHPSDHLPDHVTVVAEDPASVLRALAGSVTHTVVREPGAAVDTSTATILLLSGGGPVDPEVAAAATSDGVHVAVDLAHPPALDDQDLPGAVPLVARRYGDLPVLLLGPGGQQPSTAALVASLAALATEEPTPALRDRLVRLEAQLAERDRRLAELEAPAGEPAPGPRGSGSTPPPPPTTGTKVRRRLRGMLGRD